MEREENIVHFRKPIEVRQTFVYLQHARVLSRFLSVLKMKTHFGEEVEPDELMAGLKEKLDVVVEEDKPMAINLSAAEKDRLGALVKKPIKSMLKRVLVDEELLNRAWMDLDRVFFIAGGCKFDQPESSVAGTIIKFRK